jgi:DNA-binding NarL/FixJ family response regulator
MSRTEQIVVEIASGFCLKEIADHIGRSVDTVEFHWKNAKQKYNLKTYVDAAHFALSRGWVRNKYDS